jgi:hypothetical protein
VTSVLRFRFIIPHSQLIFNLIRPFRIFSVSAFLTVSTKTTTQHYVFTMTVSEETKKEFTQEEVSKHTTSESCWLTIGNSNNGALSDLNCEANCECRVLYRKIKRTT